MAKSGTAEFTAQVRKFAFFELPLEVMTSPLES